MSLSKKANIIKIRKKLDLLDNKLLNLVKKRTIFVKNILQNKSSKNQIVDRKRINFILNKIKDKYPKIIGEIRGVGLIKGLKMLVDNIEFVKKLMNHKMLTIKAEENVIRLFPPLIVNNKELDEATHKIEKICKEMS